LRAGDVEAIVAAREIIRAFLADRDDDAARANLNGLVAATFGAPVIGTDGELTFVRKSGNAVAGLVAPALGALLRDGLGEEGKRLKACAAPDCRWIFFDRSHGSNGRWCDMSVCGARHKMRDYRARRASGAPSPV
jgi:predicted RNA-binding Zn ribbon-like protein